MPHLFAASYLGQSLCAIVAAVVLQFVKVPPLSPAHYNGARPLWEIVRHSRFIVAVACGIASYAMMNMVMTSAPLAMVGCGHSITDAALGIQWHVLAMYGPSFITGSLIARFDVERITGIGLALIVATAVVGISGIRWRISDRSCASWPGLEFVVHRCDHDGHAMSSAA